jgi:transposase
MVIGQLKSLQQIIAEAPKEKKDYFVQYIFLEEHLMENYGFSLPEYLQMEYCANKKSLKTISKDLGVSSPSKLWRLMKKFGISVRDYSEAQQIRIERDDDQSERAQGLSVKMQDAEFRMKFSEATKNGITQEGRERKSLRRLKPGSYKPKKAELEHLFYEEHLSARKIAERCGVNIRTVYRWYQGCNIQLK